MVHLPWARVLGLAVGEGVIVGNGDIAKVLPHRDDLCFFASGVSNSGETRESEYDREYALLRQQDWQAHIVYFSSLCVFYADSRYARHKRHMEFTIRANWRHYTIVRLGNITWGSNPHTLINHLRARHAAGLPVDIQDVYRYVVDLPEFLHWLDMIPAWSCEKNIPGRRMKVEDIWREYVLMGEYA